MRIRTGAARAGAWVGLDGLGEDNVDAYAARVLAFKKAGLLDRLLLSHDAGWYTPGAPGGGNFRPYHTLFTGLLPALREQGLNDADIARLTVANPARAFAVRKRPARSGEAAAGR